MAKDGPRSQVGLPPYFNIDPDAALADLDPPADTTGFARIAAACAQGRADLASRGLSDTGGKQLRLFSTWEITRYLIPVAQAHFRACSETEPGPASGPKRNRWRGQMVHA